MEIIKDFKAVVKWFAGFFEDQKGSASSKRLSLYIAWYMVFLIVKGSLAGKVIDVNLIIFLGGMILFLVGAVTSEFFNKIKNENPVL